MGACDQLVDNASLGVAPALRAVDCLAGETTAMAFGRLFGGGQGAGGGVLAPALTVVLTLYIGFFAMSLMLGRSRLSISALSPRMLTLGLVLTFATSWMAYQNVVWNLATGAPDQIAGVLTGTQGSATQIFADRIDMIFAAIAEAAANSKPAVAAVAADGVQHAAQAVPTAASGSFSPENLMWLSALLLLLGTVGVLVTARIALAILLAVGPIFVVLALFSGTRGLTAGWLRGVVLTAVTPLFVVLGGGIMIELLVPVIQVLGGPDGINGRAALALFLVAAVHVALMMMVMKVAGTMVAGWRVFGLAKERENGARSFMPMALAPQSSAAATMPASHLSSRRMDVISAAAQAAATSSSVGSSQSATVRERGVIVAQAASAGPGLPTIQPRRARGIGSRFAAPTNKSMGVTR